MNSSIEEISLIKDNELRDFIQKYKNESPSKVVIRLSNLPVRKRNFVARQIKGRNKAEVKFPFLLKYKDIIFPHGIAIEQSSSELTAQFKSTLFKGNKAIDLTCGFGIDSIFLSNNFNQIILTEINNELLDIVKHNMKMLSIKNASYQNCPAEECIENIEGKIDLLYIDPSRRINTRKIYRVEDCSPNILEILGQMKKKAKNILIKLSPMIDVTDILNKIPNLTSIHLVSVNNECKEILVSIEDDKSFNGLIQCHELGKYNFEYNLKIEDENALVIVPSEVKKYIYLPYAVVNKAGAFKSLSKDYSVQKISQNTHLYTSNSMDASFPGKIYKVIGVIPYKSRAISKFTKEVGFKIIKRNFPDEVNIISKKMKIKQSGELYLIAYRNFKGKPELSVCSRIIV